MTGDPNEFCRLVRRGGVHDRNIFVKWRLSKTFIPCFGRGSESLFCPMLLGFDSRHFAGVPSGSKFRHELAVVQDFQTTVARAFLSRIVRRNLRRGISLLRGCRDKPGWSPPCAMAAGDSNSRAFLDKRTERARIGNPPPPSASSGDQPGLSRHPRHSGNPRREIRRTIVWTKNARGHRGLESVTTQLMPDSTRRNTGKWSVSNPATWDRTNFHSRPQTAGLKVVLSSRPLDKMISSLTHPPEPMTGKIIGCARHFLISVGADGLSAVDATTEICVRNRADRRVETAPLYMAACRACGTGHS